MKRVLTAVVLIPLVLLLVFKGPEWLMPLVLGLLSYLAVREFVGIARGHGLAPPGRLLTGFVLLLFLLPLPLAALISPFTLPSDVAWLLPILLTVLAPFVFLGATSFGADLKRSLPDAAAALFGFIYIGISLVSVWLLWWRDWGSVLVLHLLLIVWSGDIAAYYVGTHWGRRKLAPRLSPNKTWEGALASLVVATALGTVILANLWPIQEWLAQHKLLSLVGERGWGSPPVIPTWFAIIGSAIINIAAQLGDLIESAMKRGAGLKDSGTLLPGHGGILDRIDALLFAGPVAMLVFAVGSILLRIHE